MTIINKKSMKGLSLIIFGLFLLPGISTAHNGADPAVELGKKRRYLRQYQQEFAEKRSDEERVRNLKKQISNLQGTVMLLRNTLAKETKSMRKEVNDQKIDYLLALKSSLGELKKTLQQFEEMIED